MRHTGVLKIAIGPEEVRETREEIRAEVNSNSATIKLLRGCYKVLADLDSEILFYPNLERRERSFFRDEFKPQYPLPVLAHEIRENQLLKLVIIDRIRELQEGERHT